LLSSSFTKFLLFLKKEIDPATIIIPRITIETYSNDPGPPPLATSRKNIFVTKIKNNNNVEMEYIIY